MKQRTLLLMLLLCFAITSGQSQTSFGILNGRVTDSISGKGIGFANVVVIISDFNQKGIITDEKGYFTIKPLSPGEYDLIVSHMSYGKKILKQYQIKSNQVNRVNFELSEGSITLPPAEIFGNPMVEANVGPITTLSAEKLKKLPAREIGRIVELMTPGVIKGSFKGQRRSASAYYIDGVKVRGELSIPNGSIQEVQVITGALPAEYGDVLGGVVVITTKSGLYSFY